MSVFLANEQADYRVDEPSLARLARLVMDAEGVEESEISVLLVDRSVMTDLNERYMGEDRPTDVLAFPIDELRPGLLDEEPEEGVLGDLVLCPAVAERQGETAGHGTQAEVDLLTVHGILHLLGYDHAEPDEKAEMFGLQDKLLAEWRALDPT